MHASSKSISWLPTGGLVRYAPAVRTDATHTSGRFKIERAVIVMPLVFVACTRVLGIDGEYVLVDESGRVASGGAGAIFQDAQNIPPAIATGGAPFTGLGGAPSGGVLMGNGGIPIGAMTGGAGGNGVPPFDSGSTCPNCPPVGAPCPQGTYSGGLAGRHSASILAGFRIPLSGTVTFSVTPDPAGARVAVNGSIDGSATIAPNSFANFKATLTGSVTCADGSLKGTISGEYAVATGAPPVPFEGTHEGVFVNGAFDGTWSEHETANPSMSQFFGLGTWSATPAP